MTKEYKLKRLKELLVFDEMDLENKKDEELEKFKSSLVFFKKEEIK